MDEIKFEDCAANFYGKDGNPYLVRCPKCKRENYAMNVATGKCTWCDYVAPKKEV